MAKRKVYEHSNVNELTGEITYHRSYYADKYTESFLMLRTSVGKEWFYQLSNNEKNLLMILWDWSSPSDMSVYLGSVRREFITSTLGIGKRQITSILSSLVASGYIKRIGRDDFLVNPEYCFKCSVIKLRDYIKKYHES